jgi:hypothetical protein
MLVLGRLSLSSKLAVLRLVVLALLNPEQNNGPFPLPDKAVVVSPPRERQLLNGVVLPVLLLNLLRSVGQLRLLERLDKTLGSLEVLMHLDPLVLQ